MKQLQTHKTPLRLMRSSSFIQLGIVAFVKTVNVWKLNFRSTKSLEGELLVLIHTNKDKNHVKLITKWGKNRSY
jgi:hypothetical protein